MFFISIAHEVVFVADGEPGNDAVAGGQSDRSFESEFKTPESGISGVGVNVEVKGLGTRF